MNATSRHKAVAALSMAAALTAMCLTLIPGGASAANGRIVPRPDNYPAQCSLGTPCPQWLDIEKTPDRCYTDRLYKAYGQNIDVNAIDCNSAACAKDGLRAAFYEAAAQSMTLSVYPPSSIPASFIQDRISAMKNYAAAGQEYSNNVLDCGNRDDATYRLNATFNGAHDAAALRLKKTGAKFTITVAGGGLKAPKSIIKKLLIKYAGQIQIDGTVSVGSYKLTSTVSGSGRVTGKITKR